MSPVPPNYDLAFSIGGLQPNIDQFGAWQTFQGSFPTPIQTLSIRAIISLAGGEREPHDYAIDAIEFVTVPEPQTFWLLTIGAAAILLRQRLKHPNVHR